MKKISKALNESAKIRWSVMLLVSFSMAVNYYFYDALSPLKDLLSKQLGWSSSDYGFFVAAYSIPNVFLAMAVIGGIILDKIGIKITGFMFIVFMVIGACITGYGAGAYYNNGGFGHEFMSSFLKSYSPSLKMMALGYFFFGLGAETSGVVVSKIIVKWFKGKELALALGMNVALARLGTAASLVISPLLIFPSWTKPIWFGALLLAIGMLTFAIYMFFDAKLDKQLQADAVVEEEESFRFSDLGKLLTNPSFIYITLLCVTFYSAVFPFMKYAPDMMINKFGFSRAMAGMITAILPFGTIFFTPLFGWVADTKGKSASLMILGSGLLILVHLMFSLTYITPYVPMFILGIAFSLVPAAMWPAVAKIVEQNKLGTAYGLMFSIQNIGLWLFPMMIGWVLDASNLNARIELDSKQVTEIAQNDFIFKSVFINNDKSFNANKTINVDVTLRADSANGNNVWDEFHHLTTNEKGEYTIHLGNGNNVLSANFANISFKEKKSIVNNKDSVNNVSVVKDTVIDKGNFTVEISSLVDNKKIILSNEAYNTKDSTHLFNGKWIGQTGTKTLDVMILNHQTKIDTVWEETQTVLVNEKGEYKMTLGDGEFVKANSKYFDWNKSKYFAHIQTPLNYTNPVLMLAFLGLLGLLFAFLLRHDDKTSGYGLEKPNKVA